VPNSKFLADMGTASIVAGFILHGLAYLAKGKGKVKRTVKRAL
jgi:hypothetical protein